MVVQPPQMTLQPPQKAPQQPLIPMFSMNVSTHWAEKKNLQSPSRFWRTVGDLYQSSPARFQPWQTTIQPWQMVIQPWQMTLQWWQKAPNPNVFNEGVTLTVKKVFFSPNSLSGQFGG